MRSTHSISSSSKLKQNLHNKMYTKSIFFAATALIVCSAIRVDEYAYQNYQPFEEDVADYAVYSPEEAVYSQRVRRSLQPGAPGFPGMPQQKDGWSVSPNVGRDDRGNTRTSINVGHKGKDHDFDAGWGKVVRGPGRAKPTWHVRGTYKW